MEIGRFSVKVQKLRRFYVRKSKKKISLSPAIIRQCPHKYGGKLGPLPLCFRAVSCLAQTAADASSPPWGSYDEFSIKPCSTSTTDEKGGCLFLPPRMPQGRRRRGSWKTCDVSPRSYALSMMLVVRPFPFQTDLYCSGTGISI